ncbi:phage tail tube protein [Streptomyces sp. H27-D2]|uniref:phage tail tube protein n=1 Tax=Streptomyces sp. H27-D2 TaxID=3046304 RepID=UPI002DB844EC|nr:phage tail protein [Streptomyces sp. H27-D2]MEC4016407.1 phage tail protein [Streptomyces sp. H27-D2]
MAGTNGGEIRVAGTGKILVAPAGTAAPADTLVAWDPVKWKDLGFTTTDGIKFNKKDKLDPVDTWQSVSPARFIYSDRDLTVKFQLLQMNKDTLPFFMGGDPIEAGAAAGQYKFNLSTSPKSDERALGIEFTDGTLATYRFIIPRGQVTDTEEITLTRSGAIKLGVTFTAIAVDDVKPLATWLMKDASYL